MAEKKTVIRPNKFMSQEGDIEWLDDDKEEKNKVERAVQGEQLHDEQQHVAQSIEALFESVAKRGDEKLTS